MEKVWRPFSVWERRPVTPLNGAISGCFRKKTSVFVNKCKTGNSVPFRAAALWRADPAQPDNAVQISLKNNALNKLIRNWHTLRLSPCKTAI
jgi:hypothetical protein